MSATNGSCARFRHAKVLPLPLLNQVLHRARHVFDRYVQVHSVLIEEVNSLDLESLERGFLSEKP